MSEPADLQPRPDVCEGPETGVILDDRYQLLHVLGAGGYSTVYAAHDRRIKGPVAVKLLKPWCGPKEHRRFEIEIVISGRMVHPHVIRMTDAGEYNGQPYAVSPRLAGRQLWKHRGEHWRNVALYMRQYLEGMRALHEASAFVDPAERTRVLHRDIKPANCMVSPEGHVTIIDLGVIKPLDLKLRETTAGTLVGSTAYMAPELLFQLDSASERSDVYSLGVSFYQMLTGELPYVGNSVDEVREQYAACREPPNVRELRSEIPSALAALVQNAMAPRPVDRPASVAEMLDMLETILVRTGGWGLGFGPRVAMPPSIDARAPRPPAPAPAPTPLSVIVPAQAPAPPPSVDAAPVVDAPAPPPSVDAAPAVDAPIPRGRAPISAAAPPPAVAPPCDDAAPTLPPPRPAASPVLPPPRPAASPAPPAAKPTIAPAPTPAAAKKRWAPALAAFAAAVIVSAGAVLLFFPPSSDRPRLDLAEQDVGLAELAAPPVDTPKNPEPPEAAAPPVDTSKNPEPPELAVAPPVDTSKNPEPPELAAAPPVDTPKNPEPPELADNIFAAGGAPAGTASRAKKPRPPATLTADAVSDIMNRAAEKLRACDDAPRGWVPFAVQVRDRRATLQALGLDAPGTCVREVVAALRFPAGAGDFRGSLRL